MISVRGVEKRFGRLDVLRGLDLEIGSGRVTAVLGPNGAGKSTLIKCILGLVRPDAGEILLDGEPLLDAPARRARIGYMAQTPQLPGNLSGVELLELMRDLRPGAVDVDEQLIELLELGSELRKPLRTLSGGTRQKMNAVIAFLFRPDVLVLDEPTAGLDPVASSAFKDAVLGARCDGRTVIVTSHILSEVEELADDVAFIVDGRLRYHGALHGLRTETSQPTLERAIARLMRDGRAA